MVPMTATLDFHGAIQKLLSPYTLDGPARHVTVVQDGWGTRVEINAIAKPRHLPERPTQEQVRTALMKSANAAIGLLEEFGFRHHDAPRIEFGGQVAYRMSQDPIIVTECTLRLNLLPPKAEEAS
jgi:hypothetical protein